MSDSVIKREGGKKTFDGKGRVGECVTMRENHTNYVHDEGET